MDTRTIFLLLLGFVGFNMFRLSLGVPVSSIMSEFSINEIQAGWLFSAPVWSIAFLLAPSGYLADRFGQKKILLIGYLILALGVTMIVFSRDYLQCLASMIIAGAGGGILGPSYYSMIGESLSRVRGLAIGLAVSAGNLGGLIGSVLLGVFVAQQQWRIGYLSIGVIIFLATVAQLVGVGSSFARTRHIGEFHILSYTKLLRTRIIFFSIISIFFAGMSFGASITWLPTFLQSFIGLDAATTSLVFGLFILVGVPSSLLLGALSDYISRSLLTCITGITAAVVSIPMFSTQYSFWPSIIYSIVFGFLMMPSYNLLITLSQESVNEDSVTSVTGMALTSALIGAAVGPVITSILIPLSGISQASIYTISLSTLIYGLFALATVKISKEQ